MRRIIDLTHPVYSGMPVYPGDCETELVQAASVGVEGYNLTRVTMSAHAGTHLDAPYHFLDEGAALEQIPIECLVGTAEILDLGELGPGAEITPAMLERFSRRVGKGSRVLLKTGWGRRFGSPEFFASHPNLTPEAARWLVDRQIALLGVEEPSLHTSGNAAVHRIILGAGIPLIENLANLNLIDGQSVFFAALPLNLVGRDGAPVRAIAILGGVS